MGVNVYAGVCAKYQVHCILQIFAKLTDKFHGGMVRRVLELLSSISQSYLHKFTSPGAPLLISRGAVNCRAVMNLNGLIKLTIRCLTERQFDWLNPGGAIDSTCQRSVVV